MKILSAIVLLAACSSSGHSAESADAGASSPDASGSDASESGWTATVRSETGLLGLQSDGCLADTGQLVESGAVLPLAAVGEHFAMSEDRSFVALSTISIDGVPSDAASVGGATVQVETTRQVLGSDGCLTDSTEMIIPGSERLAIAKMHDEQFRGAAVIDRDLGFVPVRILDSEEWSFPWQTAVQLVKEVDEGFVIGGGVLIAENALLSAAHLDLDETWCYTREPAAGAAWEDELFVCGNIVETHKHPDGVDIAVSILDIAEPPPHALIRQEPATEGEEFFSTQFSQLIRHSFADSTVESVGSDNAFCDDWPAQSSFMSADLIVGGGDSGGPAFIGEELVGLVHGERCKQAWEDTQHVFVHVPGVAAFVQSKIES